ncbi:MAG: sulfurtransferase TusA family protein [Elusimicrobiota bacterium]|nr:sulfurtransferase TusA family protein [Elusimicrobiota bacterium]
MFKLPKKVIEDIQIYKEKLNKYLSGEINDNFFRGIRVPWGIYTQRGGKNLMVRLRIPAGVLTASQLRGIAESAEKFADGKLHITTRQDIQIHNVSFENSLKIIEYLKDFNISPRAGGGNTIRNVTCCYLSGICPYENFEVYKIAWALTEYFLSLEETINLPRKIKIAFSGCSKDCGFVGVNDIGVVSLGNNNFKVICGGGMGAKSSVGKVLEENVELKDIGYVVKSIINIYNKYGDRKNRHHNRLRFLIEDIGWDKFYKLHKKEYENLKNNEYISLRFEDGLPILSPLNDEILSGYYEDKNYNLFVKYNIGKQKQKGYYYAEIRIPLGEINSTQIMKLSDLQTILPNVIFRTTQRQNLVVSNIPYDKFFYVYEKIKTIFKDFLFPNTILDVVSCKASTTCNLGICNAIDMAKESIKEITSKLMGENYYEFIEDKFINTDFIDKLKSVKINISGCPNACGHHPIGTISFSGLARKVYNRTVPFYKVYYGGKVDAENTQFAKEVGILPSRAVPKFISELILSINSALTEENFELIKNLILKYSYVPPYEENRIYYMDWGKNEDFSLDGLSQGECGAGVIDMIEADLESAKSCLMVAKDNNYNLDEIKKALIYSARALLIVKGIDPKTEEESIIYFIEKFIKEGICSPQFNNLKDVFSKIVKKEIDTISAYEYTENFYNEIKNIYSLMDSNFNFQVRFLNQQLLEQLMQSTEYKQQITIYDLRGTPCPINYVKAKLKLEELNIGDILEIYLDDGAPIQNVPKSLENDGQEVLNIKKMGDYYKVTIKKKV